MLHFHATQKLLNTSRIKPVLYVSEPSSGQRLHNWYVTLCGSGFAGKMLMLYVHEPSLLTVVVKGKSIATTIENFRSQLRLLLYRHEFPQTFIEKEMTYLDDFIVGKTMSRSMLGHINQMVEQVAAYNLRYLGYNEIDVTVHEDIFMEWFHKSKLQRKYTTPREYWSKELKW